MDALSENDRLQFVKFGVGPTVASPFECVHHAFKFHALANPNAIAVQDINDSITYAELDRRSTCLAARLRSGDVRPGSRVCLLVDRSIWMVVAILGVLKSGAAYVPLDGKIVSDASLQHILKDSRAEVVLTLDKFSNRLSILSTPPPAIILDRDQLCDCSADYCCPTPVDLSSSTDSVYVIYTSGTTGSPKGVDVLHRNVTNLLCLEPGNLGMAPGVRVSQLMNISFDMAAWEILGSMSNGATLYLRGQSSKEWKATMKKVDVVIGTPSMLAPHSVEDYPNIKVVAVAGEACPPALADSWARSTRFYNCCGPTEVTIVNTMQLHQVGDPISIGGPIPNNTVYILDDLMKPVPIGAVGIMWGGGACVSRQYLNLPDKTQERYRLDPFANDGSMMFNTGDLGCWRADGTLEHLGRIDDQVKVKGFRVELAGVAVAMESSHGVKAACAIVVDGALHGFVTPETINVEEVKAATAKIQPYYAVPSHIHAINEFPRTKNDKIDKTALRQLAVADDSSSMSSLTLATNTPASEPEKEVAIATPPLALVRHSIVGHDYPSQPPNAAELDVKKEFWDGYQDDELPEKVHGKLLRNLRHQIFSLYRRLFGIVFITNMAIFIAILARGGANAQRLGLITLANLFVAILMRQDYVINTFFNVLCSVPSSWPLMIRRVCARVYHIGGLHSGSATSGVVWLILTCGQATKELVHGGPASIPTVTVSYVILLLLLGIVTFAYPALRTKRHDSFERVHRYLGWTGVALVWCQVVLLTNDYRGVQSLAHALVHSAPFWMLLVMTGSIILPWTRLRKVPVRSEVLSKHAVRLYFTHATPKTGSFVRLAVDPLKDWHGFATIPVPNEKGFSLVVSKAGDWTSERISDPPTSIWIRGAPCFGVLRIVPLFRRVVLVATGSGIGPCAPCILENKIPIRLLWTSPNVRETFGDKLVDEIVTANPEACIYDTKKHGKPDMVKLTLRLVEEFNAEAVCIISNQKLTQKVVYGVMSRGIPAFGAIWDS
ncbi:Nonribosomal peptide synthetase 12 [Mycena indigotica]|uniref:Nonribosomal peptide synthetase 12 n=1 Tax=Mycena indigotica TaxID=2126181 RepID=A0A8H6SHF2_9AGAR|nr:Nonribosomal peptide synthetase 12 [Mycena indigotica]KAF7299018.1 Nonribosomal peptide synthetase 12 [Mycena indigotica]